MLYNAWNSLLMTHKMNGKPIEVTASHAYLGIGINNKLSGPSILATQIQRQIRSLASYVKVNIVALALLKKALIRHWLDRS